MTNTERCIIIIKTVCDQHEKAALTARDPSSARTAMNISADIVAAVKRELK